jgi:hypothetical protein
MTTFLESDHFLGKVTTFLLVTAGAMMAASRRDTRDVTHALTADSTT